MIVKVQVTLNVVDLLLIHIWNWLNIRRNQTCWKLRGHRCHSMPDSWCVLHLVMVSVGW